VEGERKEKRGAIPGGEERATMVGGS